jgi:hypothetical protein
MSCRKQLIVYMDSQLCALGKVVPVRNQLKTTPSRRMGEWMYASTFP